MPTAQQNRELAVEISRFYDDPLGFVRCAYSWGERGPLETYTGPDENQVEFLRALGNEVKARQFDGATPVMPIRMAETSGHGTGKSAMGAWIADWILSTRPNSVGTVTAGTATQLEERTWSAIQWWTKLCITAPWFEILASGIFSRLNPDSWKLVPQTCKEENAQSFAGQHAATSTSWYLFDEASTVPDGIYRVAYGGLTDGEPMFFAWGQPERNSGQFYEICFGREKARWNSRNVDSRNSRFTNKALIQEWLSDYGEDSDWFRVRVRGLPPKADELQYIDKQRVEEAAMREVWTPEYEPLVLGVDVSGGGKAWNVIRGRRGLDAKSFKPIRLPGDNQREREVIIALLAELLADPRPSHKIGMVFIDAAFGTPIVERLHVLGYENVIEVNFGGRAPDVHCLNMRAFMYKALKEWLLRGAIERGDEKLIGDLTAPGYHLNNSGKLVLEPKEDVAQRLGRSTDDSDALALTFAQVVAPPAPRRQRTEPSVQAGPNSWMA